MSVFNKLVQSHDVAEDIRRIMEALNTREELLTWAADEGADGSGGGGGGGPFLLLAGRAGAGNDFTGSLDDDFNSIGSATAGKVWHFFADGTGPGMHLSVNGVGEERLLVGQNVDPTATFFGTDVLQFAVVSEAATDPGSGAFFGGIYAGTDPDSGPTFFGIRSRGTIASPTTTNTDDQVFTILGFAYDVSNNAVPGTGFTMSQDAPAITGFFPGRLSFLVVSDIGVPHQILVKNNGKVEINADLDGVAVQAPRAARLVLREEVVGDNVLRLLSLPAATADSVTFDNYQGEGVTTDATPTTIFTLPIAPSTSYLVEARVVARRTSGLAGTANDAAAYIRRTLVSTKTGTVTPVALSNDSLQDVDQPAWDVTYSVSGTDLRLQVTGAASNNISWHATILVQRVSA